MTPFIGLTAFVACFVPPAADIADMMRAARWADAQKATKQLLRGPDQQRAAGALWLLLRDRSLPGRASIVSDVGAARFAPAVPVLADLLDDPEPGVRTWSAIALGQIGDRSAVPALTRRLKAPTDPAQTDS